MKNILIPMDFTEVSLNALRYALSFYEMERIHIIHCTFGKYYNDTKFEEPKVEKKAILTTELKKDVLNVLGKSELPEHITIDVLRGEIIPNIKKYIAENNIHSVIMGTRDKYNLFDKWLGTVSLRLVKNLDIPVYVVPPHAKFNEFKKVLIASDAHLKNSDVMDQIKSWNNEHKAFLKFLHISNPQSKGKYEAAFEELFESGDPDFGFEMNRISDSDISSSLLSIAYNEKCDLIISIPDDQNFIQSLLFKSVSKELILKSDIPILFLKSRSPKK